MELKSKRNVVKLVAEVVSANADSGMETELTAAVSSVKDMEMSGLTPAMSNLSPAYVVPKLPAEVSYSDRAEYAVELTLILLVPSAISVAA